MGGFGNKPRPADASGAANKKAGLHQTDASRMLENRVGRNHLNDKTREGMCRQAGILRHGGFVKGE
jgi:hypothetical protein